jgi:RNA polymerase sigma-70 factor, ECF subfamily
LKTQLFPVEQDELSLQEIADSIGCNVNAAKTRLYRSRERFRVLYEKVTA